MAHKRSEIPRVPLFYVGSQAVQPASVCLRAVEPAEQPAKLFAASMPSPLAPYYWLIWPAQETLDSPIDRRSDFYRQAVNEERPLAEIEPQPIMTPPNILTFLRIVLIPVFVCLWYTERERYAPLAAALVFIAASITDWLDGFLARKLKMTTAFGAFLDPVADKLMVTTALILLATQPPAPLTQRDLTVPVMIIIGREIMMSSLREWAAASCSGAHKAVKVNSLGKWKTALQMVGMSSMLVFRRLDLILGTQREVVEMIHNGTMVSLALLWMGAFLAVWSLSNYLANVWVHFRYPNGHPVHNPIKSG